MRNRKGIRAWLSGAAGILAGRVKDILHPLKVYDVYFVEDLEHVYEDPRCPSQWRGSGCYDITIYAQNQYRLIVCARNEQEAVEYAVEDYMSRTGDYTILGVLRSDMPVPCDACDGDEVEFLEHPAREEDWSGRMPQATLERLMTNLAI